MAFWEGIFREEDERDNFRDSWISFDGLNPPPKPLIASLMLTHNCNLKCLYCPFRQTSDFSENRAVHEWEYLIEKICAIGLRRISFSGGEPLLYKGLARLINKSSLCGVQSGVVTNGTKLTEKMLKNFAKSGLNALTVSIDTVEANLYGELCQPGNESISRVLDMVIAAKNLGEFWVGINTVLTRLNLKTIGRTIEFFSSQDIPIQLQIINPQQNMPDLLPSPEEMEGAIETIKELKKSGALISNSENYLDAFCEFVKTRRFPDKMECLIPFVEIVITPDLKLKMCCNSSVVGDAIKADWNKIWQSDEANRWRRLAKEKSCRNCFLIYHEPLE